MKKYLIITLSLVSIFSGVACATQMLETDPSVYSPGPIVRIPRPSLSQVLDRRPALPGKGRPAATGTDTTTGAMQWDGFDKPLIRQNPADVQAYREEYGYVKRYLIKPATDEEKKTMSTVVAGAIKNLLAAQKQMRSNYKEAVKSTILMTQEEWDGQADTAISAYRAALLPYVDSTMKADFDKFIIGRTNLLKGLFATLEKERLKNK